MLKILKNSEYEHLVSRLNWLESEEKERLDRVEESRKYKKLCAEIENLKQEVEEKDDYIAQQEKESDRRLDSLENEIDELEDKYSKKINLSEWESRLEARKVELDLRELDLNHKEQNIEGIVAKRVSEENQKLTEKVLNLTQSLFGNPNLSFPQHTTINTDISGKYGSCANPYGHRSVESRIPRMNYEEITYGDMFEPMGCWSRYPSLTN